MNQVQLIPRHTNSKDNPHVAHLQQSYTSHITKLAIPSQEGLRLIGYKDILFIEADGNYSIIHTVSGKRHVTAKTLGKFEKRLGDQGFVRSHQSYLVQATHIEYMCMQDTCELTLSNGSKVPISRRRGAELKQYLMTQCAV